MKRAVIAQSMNPGMNTLMTHRAFGKYAEEALSAVSEEAVRLEKQLSYFLPDSEISKINRSAGLKHERISEDAFEVLSQAAEHSRKSQGLFDVTIGPLVHLWSSCKNTLEAPHEAWIKQLLPLVKHTDLILNPHERTAGLHRSGQSINLGGIGKGFAGDKFVEVLKKYDISSAFTNIGGNVVALGAKPDGSPWRVGIQHPREENGLLGVVSVVDKAVVTSGDYQRYFIDKNGKRQHHILDPATGYPAEAGVVSATVVADSSMAADALSTMLFAAGIEKGSKLLCQFPGVEAIVVDLDLQVYVTAGLKHCFQAEKGLSINVFDNWRRN